MKFKELINFWNFWKESSKEANELLLLCSDSYNTFKENIHRGHHQNFRTFKMKFLKDSKALRKEIVDCKDDNLKLILINHLQKQLDYFNENHFGPYASKVDMDKFNNFIANNYPYQDTVNKLKSDYLVSINNKMDNNPIVTPKNRM